MFDEVCFLTRLATCTKSNECIKSFVKYVYDVGCLKWPRKRTNERTNLIKRHSKTHHFDELVHNVINEF